MDDWRTRLSAALASKGVKRTYFSEELGFSRDYITRLLKPESNPNLKNLEKICAALEVSFAYIYTGKQEDPVYDEVINRVTKMGENDLVALRDHLRQPRSGIDIESDD